MQSCIEECLRCYSTCLGMLMNHCLQAGGKHMEAEHVRIMHGLRRDVPHVGRHDADRHRTP